MTKEKIIEMAEECVSHKTCDNCKFSNFSDGETDCNTVLAKYIVEKENEPAPSSNDTSSNHKNTTNLDDTAKLEICQEKLLKIWGRNTDVLGHCIDICDMIHSVSEMIRTVLDVLNDLEKLGDTNAN